MARLLWEGAHRGCFAQSEAPSDSQPTTVPKTRTMRAFAPGRDCGDGESVRERELRWRTWRSECRRVWWQPQVLQDAVNDGAVGYQGDQAAA